MTRSGHKQLSYHTSKRPLLRPISIECNVHTIPKVWPTWIDCIKIYNLETGHFDSLVTRGRTITSY